MTDGPLPGQKAPKRKNGGLAVGELLWRAIGIAALAVSIWLLSRGLRSISFDEIGTSLSRLSMGAWFASTGSALLAYFSLGFYDRLALAHIGKRLDAFFVHICAATTYAFAHVVGASVFSGALVRYRAYSVKGLLSSEVATLVAFCTLTFALGVMTVLGVVLVAQPFIVDRFLDTLPLDLTSGTGKLLLGAVVLYPILSLLPLGEIRAGSLSLSYPRLRITLLQIVVATLEILAAAAIIYFALPPEGNPGFMTVTGVFVLSFSAALISHSPGGLGVFELAFLTGLPEIPRADALAALLVFRMFYFFIPFLFACVAIAVHEIRRR